jgi:hypothetical protein
MIDRLELLRRAAALLAAAAQTTDPAARDARISEAARLRALVSAMADGGAESVGEIHRLLYVSIMSEAAAASLANTMEDILVEAARLNARDGVTGFLLCDGIHFVQVLEGGWDEVEACFARIETDRRHFAVEARLREDTPRRLFPRWSMCGLTLSDLDDALLATPQIEFHPRRVDPGAVLQQVESLAVRFGDRLDARHAPLLHPEG